MIRSDTAATPRYSILIPDETVARIASYLRALRAGQTRAGGRLRKGLQGADLQTMTELDLLGKLFDTKQPQIFAESQVCGDGSDWTLAELGILGDVSVAVPVTVFDNGRHSPPIEVHQPPFAGTLLFTPGALLQNGQGCPPADLAEVTGADGNLAGEGYYSLYRRRLLPVFRYVNDHAAGPRSAFLTIPGLGCGQFAGSFRGRLGAHLQAVLERFLKEYGAAFPNLRAVYFDPYSECQNARFEIHGISYMVRPLTNGNEARPQLCPPSAYAEEGDDFSACSLFSIVAWDHVSWPGNDFYAGSRATDDGVKAAATNSMAVLTGVEGIYDPARREYQPPGAFRNWEAVVKETDPRLWNPAAVWPWPGPT
jgi:hypothetical protein